MAHPTIYSTPQDLERRPDPYGWLGELREAGPVQRLRRRDGLDAWIVTRYDDVQRGIADPRLASNPRHAEQVYATSPYYPPGVDNASRTSMLSADPPDHSRLRRAVARAFTPRRVEGLRPRIQQIADELLDAVAPRGRADVVRDFAFPLPVRVICELLGVNRTGRLSRPRSTFDRQTSSS
jgi:cytochrome P450